MSNVKRVYVEKKSGFDVQAKELKTEIRSYLGIKDVDSVRVLIRYDVENVSDETFEKACGGVFAEPPVDILYRESFTKNETDRCFSTCLMQLHAWYHFAGSDSVFALVQLRFSIGSAIKLKQGDTGFRAARGHNVLEIDVEFLRQILIDHCDRIGVLCFDHFCVGFAGINNGDSTALVRSRGF